MRTIRRPLLPDEGSATVEYAVVALAVALVAALFYALVTGDSVTGWLTDLVHRAFSTPS